MTAAVRVGLATAALLLATPAAAELPGGYLVWSKGTIEDPATRRIWRMTLPDPAAVQALTSGEDVEPQLSPDGRWVAYAKAKFPGGSDYHDFRLWKLYLVSVHGTGDGRKEIKIDDDGAWPSWGSGGALYYNQADGTHTRIVRVEIDDQGQVLRRRTLVSSRERFGGYGEINEAVVAPDESWFAARTRGNSAQNGVSAFGLVTPAQLLLARAGTIGCMPAMAPSGRFALIAGAGEGIRWGHGPGVADRREDQLLVAPRSPQHLAYHPGISSDGRWVLAAQGADPNHNAGAYDVFIHPFDAATMTAGEGQPLAAGGFNGWPHLWVGTPGPPPPPRPEIGTFFASSYTVAPGEVVALSWTTFGADRVSLDGAPVESDGNQEVRPQATSTHRLLAESSRVTTRADQTLVITVNPTPRPVAIAAFTGEAERIEQGDSTTLRWRVENATTLDLGGEQVAPEGSREVDPLETTTYRLSARGHQGPVQAELTVVVTAPESGLLPDRGGFRCGFGGGRGDGEAVLFVVLALLGGIGRSRARLRTATRRRPGPATGSRIPPATPPR